jgi:hypothetical protein
MLFSISFFVSKMDTSKAISLLLELTQSPTQWVPGAGRVSNHSTPSSDKVKGAWKLTVTLPTCLHGAVLRHIYNPRPLKLEDTCT